VILGWALLSILSCTSSPKSTPPSQLNEEDLEVIRSIFDEALANGQGYGWLEELCLDIGPRLSGSQNAADAVSWGKSLMEELDFDQVFLQDVMVPHWERGKKETAQIVGGDELAMLAIGGSVATPDEGIKAKVVEVFSLDEVDDLGETGVKGKIVFYNRCKGKDCILQPCI